VKQICIAVTAVHLKFTVVNTVILATSTSERSMLKLNLLLLRITKKKKTYVSLK
jgi:hypothetical protein